MKCPVDGATLVMSERQTIEIDYCPECRGVWLDRGELDKIIERADQSTAPTPGPTPPPAPVAPQAPPPPQPQHQPQYQQPPQRDWRYDSDQHQAVGWGGQKKKKKNFLSELFDD